MMCFHVEKYIMIFLAVQCFNVSKLMQRIANSISLSPLWVTYRRDTKGSDFTQSIK